MFVAKVSVPPCLGVPADAVVAVAAAVSVDVAAAVEAAVGVLAPPPPDVVAVEVAVDEDVVAVDAEEAVVGVDLLLPHAARIDIAAELPAKTANRRRVKRVPMSSIDLD